MGGDQAPEEIVAGARAGCRRVRDRRRARRADRRLARGHRRSRAHRLQRGHRDGRRPRPGVRRKKDSSLVVPRNSCATAGRARWCRPATPARRWPRPSCGWVACRRRAALRSRRRSRSRGRRRSCSVTPARTPSAQAERLVQFAQMARAYVDRALRRRAPRSACSRSARKRRRDAPCEGDPRAAWPDAQGVASSATSRAAT